MIDAYNISHMLLAKWRKYAINPSGLGSTARIPAVPVYVEVNGELVKIVDVIDQDDKIVLIKEPNVTSAV